MLPAQNFLYYKTPDNEFQMHYGNVDKPFKDKITTQLPKIVAIVRAALACLLSTMVIMTTAVWPVAIAGLAYAGWTIYTNLIRKDPLVEAFYKIVGGKEKYDQLPEIKLAAGIPASKSLAGVVWKDVANPLSRATTEDGRRIFIVKALTRHPENGINQVKTIVAFIEKYDVVHDEDHKPLTPLESFLRNTMKAISLTENNESSISSVSSSSWSFGIKSSNKCQEDNRVYSTITDEMANEFFAQKKIPASG